MMDDHTGNTSVVENDSLFQEELAHVEELLISSREECIEIGSKYHNLSVKVESLLNLHESSSPAGSASSEQAEEEKESRAELEEFKNRYETRIADYQQNHQHQTRIVNDLQDRVEEYRLRCAKLEAALAEHSAQEASILESDSQNVLSMDLDTALIRLEQEKNRSQGLTQINNLLREQLETATEVNQTLTSDIQRLTKEWQHARAQLLEKESEWKEEEQTFNFYFTKESNILLQMWRKILDFKHDFANLKRQTQRELSSFKVCICNGIQNITDVKVDVSKYSGNDHVNDAVDAKPYLGYGKVHNEYEITRLQERISELVDRNERIKDLLDEKEKANSLLCNTVEKISESFNQSVPRNKPSIRENQLENLCTQYSKAAEDLSQILLDDGNVEKSLLFTIIPLSDSSSGDENQNIPNANVLHLQSLVNAVKLAFQKYHRNAEENSLKMSTLNEQNAMQRRTIEFLEDEKSTLQQLNSQLSLQFESLNEKMQTFLAEMKSNDDDGFKQNAALESLVKNMKDQVDSLRTERDHLLSVQGDLYSKVQTANEEKRLLKHSEQILESELKRSTKQNSELETKLELLKSEFQSTQEKLNQISLDNELLEEEKIKFSSVVSHLTNQCFDLQECLKKLRDEENFVKDSLATLQNLSENLSAEKSELSKSLDKALAELESSRNQVNSAKVEMEKQKVETKLEIDKLQYRCLELEGERDALQNQLLSIEALKREAEEERSQTSIMNNDLANQVTKYSSQKKNIETELEQVREELQHHKELLNQANLENNNLIKTNSELAVRLKTVESESSQLNDVIDAFKDEKAHLESDLYTSQQNLARLQEVKGDITRDYDFQMSSVKSLQAQITDLQQLHEKYVEEAAKEKNALLLNIQQVEQEFQTCLKNERQQHNIDIEIITEEKTALRTRMVSAIDELFERHQQQQDELLNHHQEEVANLKRQISSHERGYDEKIHNLKSESQKIHNDYKQEVSILENTIENLKMQLSNKEELIESLKNQISAAERNNQNLVEEKMEAVKKIKSEINNMNVEHSNEVKNLEIKLKNLRQEKDALVNEVESLEERLNDMDTDKNKIAKELDETNFYYENEKSSKSLLEERITIIQNKLSDEQGSKEVLNKSLEDCKNRLKLAQRENSDLKNQMEEFELKLNEKESAISKLNSQTNELKNMLKEVEKSRQDTKRELHNLKKSVSSLEKTITTKEEEINEIHSLHNREEEIQEDLKREIVHLKQKVMESSATNEAISKELNNAKQRSADLEHKLRMQQEQHQSLLQECLSNEQNLSDHRLNIERSMTEASREIHSLRTSLNFEEGKVLALETKIIKLDGAKRDVENKLYSVCSMLRSILGIGSDSGFLSSTSNLQSSPMPSRGSFPDQLAEGRTPARESPHRMNLSKSGASAQFSMSDLDVELLKSSLMDLVQKFNTAEKERDDLKDYVSKLQHEGEDLKSEHSRCMSTIYQLKRELDDKKNLEKELATKIASIYHYEEVIRTLEREKRRLTERINSVEFDTSSSNKEKENLHEKVSQLKQVEVKLHAEISALNSAKEASETKAVKLIQAYQSIEADLENLKDSTDRKDQEIKSLEQKLDAANKKWRTVDSHNKTLQSNINQLNVTIQKYSVNEQVVEQKNRNLSISLSQSASLQQDLYDEMEKKQKESIKNQSELFKLQQLNEQLRLSAEESKLKYKALQEEVENLKISEIQTENNTREQLQHIQKLQNLLFTSQNLEKDASLQMDKLQEQKQNLEEKVRNLSALLRTTKEELGEKEDMCQKLEKEKANLKKSHERIEKEKARSSEVNIKSLKERNSLESRLRLVDIENETLQQKVQNLQAQLAEMEERHSQRVKDFLKSSESKFEESSLRSALKQAEQLLEAREKTYRRRVMGLEEQILVLKSHLEQEQSRWQQYHQRSLNASANIGYLHSVLSKSLQNVSDDPQKLLPEAERLDITTETVLTASPGISITTPSKLRRSGSHVQMTSTPKAKKRLNLSSTSKS